MRKITYISVFLLSLKENIFGQVIKTVMMDVFGAAKKSIPDSAVVRTAAHSIFVILMILVVMKLLVYTKK